MPLPRINNIFVSNSVLIFISRFFPAMANLLVTIWFSRKLLPEDFGRYQYFWIQLNILYPLACFGIHQLLVTYSKGKITNILSRIKRKHYILFLFWMFGLSALFAWLQSQYGITTFTTAFLFLLTFSVNVITESLLIVFRRFGVLCVTGFLYALAYSGIHRMVAEGTLSLEGIFSFLLIMNMLRMFIYSMSVLSEVKKDKDGYEDEYIDERQTVSLWLHLGVYDASQMLFGWIDKFVISLVLSASMSAVYYNGAQNIPFLPLLLSAAGSAVLMQLAGNKDADDKASMLQLVNQLGRTLSCIVFPAFCYLFVFRNELIVNLFSEKYIPAIPVFAVSILVLPARAYSFTTVLQRMHRGDIINIGAIADLVLACGLMYPLYTWFRLPGVAMAFVITTYLQAAFYVIYTARLLQVPVVSLLPLGNWGWKMILFFSIFTGLHQMSSVYFTGRFTLILGGVLTLVLIVLSLVAEYYRHRHYGTGAKKIKEYR